MQESGLNMDGKDLGGWGGECDGDIHSFIHSWSKDLLTTYSFVSIILRSGVLSVSKTDMPGRLV